MKEKKNKFLSFDTFRKKFNNVLAESKTELLFKMDRKSNGRSTGL